MTLIADLVAGLRLKPDKGSFAEGSNMLNGIKKAVVGFLAFETAKKIGETVQSTIDLGGHLDDLRQKTGLSAEALQSYGFAAKLGGSDMDSFAHGVTKLARTLEEAKKGSAEAGQALQKAGLTSAAQAAALKSPDGLDAALQEIADKFADMPDGAQKSALAMQVFGKSGVELIPTLNQGGDGLRKLKQEAKDLGVVMGEDAVGAADALGDNIDKLKMSVTGLKNQAVGALFPLLKSTVDSMLEFIKANRAEIVEAMTTAVEGLIAVLRGIGFIITRVIVPAFNFFRDHMELTESIIVALGVVIADFAIAAAVDWVIAFAPLLLVIAAITAVVMGIRWLIRNWDIVTQKFYAAAQAVRNAFVAVEDAITSNLIAAGQRVQKFFAEDIPNAVRAAWEALVLFVQEKSLAMLKALKDNKVTNFILSAGGTGAGNIINNSGLIEGAEKGIALKKQAKAAAATGVGQASAPGAAAGAPAPSVPGQPQASNVTIHGGDTKIEINGAQDPRAVAAAVQQHMDAAMNGMLNEAREVIS